MKRERDIEIEELKKKILRLENILLKRYNAPEEEVYNVSLSPLSTEKDILYQIFTFLPKDEIFKLSTLSKLLREVCNLLYQQKLFQEFPKTNRYFLLTKLEVNFMIVYLAFKFPVKVKQCPICYFGYTLNEDQKELMKMEHLNDKEKNIEMESNGEDDHICENCYTESKEICECGGKFPFDAHDNGCISCSSCFKWVEECDVCKEIVCSLCFSAKSRDPCSNTCGHCSKGDYCKSCDGYLDY